MFTVAGIDLGSPDPTLYAKSFSYCDAIPKSNTVNRSACYGGFGKEFTVLAQDHDVRDIGDMQAPALKNVRAWCASAHDARGEADCNGYALSSLFWGGENNPNASLLFCEIAPDSQKQECYQQLGGAASYYLAGNPSKDAVCSKFPDAYRSYCTNGQ